jgi:hypothetical protein
MVSFISLLYRRLGLCGTSVPYTDMLEEETDHDQEHRDNQGTRTVLSVADPGFLSRIPDPDFFIPDLQKQQQKRGMKKKICCHTFLCSHKFHKIEIYFSFEVLKKQIWANFHSVRHVTGNDQDYLRKIPRVVVQKSALL